MKGRGEGEGEGGGGGRGGRVVRDVKIKMTRVGERQGRRYNERVSYGGKQRTKG